MKAVTKLLAWAFHAWRRPEPGPTGQPAKISPPTAAAVDATISGLLMRRSLLSLRSYRLLHVFALSTLLLSLASSRTASALVLDWDSVAWADGSLANSYDIDLGTPGSDISISMTGNTNTFTNESATFRMTPAITQNLQGGLNPIENSLQLAANLKTTSDIYVNVSFSNQYYLGVSGVSFTIFDIDQQANDDRISGIYGIALDGTHVAATISNVGSAVTVTGSGLGLVLTGNATANDTGAGSSNGNATISFGATPITGFVFDYNNTNGAPKYQHIGISDIGFIPIPETNALLPAGLLCAVAAGLELRRRRRLTAR